MNTDVSANASKETCSGNDKDNYKILLPSSPELSDIIMTSLSSVVLMERNYTRQKAQLEVIKNKQ